MRIGTHGTFLQAMIEQLARHDQPVLSKLGTRDPADPVIALLDAGATMMDILTFYGERILNEGYLGTATEALSVEALARLVGYAPRPGVSAGVHLAYQVETGHADVPIPAGSRSQSVPAPGELPQTFETSDDLIAQAPLSALHARLTRPPLVLPGQIESRDYYLSGLSTGLRVNDTLLFTFVTDERTLRALMDVHTVEPDAPHGRTRVGLAFHGSIEQDGAAESKTLVARLRQRLTSEHLTELNLDTGMASVQRLSGLVQRSAEQPSGAQLTLLRQQLDQEGQAAARQGWRNVRALVTELIAELSDLGQAGVNRGGVAKDNSTVTRILGDLRRPPSVQPATSLLLTRNVRDLIGGATDSAPRLYAALYPQLRPQVYAALATAQVAPEAALTNVDVFRVKAGLFGATIPRSIIRPRHPVDLQHAWSDLLGLSVNADDEVTVPPGFDAPVDVLALNGEYPQIKVGSWLAVERPGKPGLPSRQNRIRTFHEVKATETVSVAADSL
ncbi:hypothetical protein, partial [Deinococcus sp.]|uniref:hypothetical protein n=1 Tax=Deinococcus sp. TaxID=47478 RepID=UPI00286992B6